jgi:hypothetical protein
MPRFDGDRIFDVSLIMQILKIGRWAMDVAYRTLNAGDFSADGCYFKAGYF